MVVTFPANQASGGLRRINPNKDLPQVVELLHLVFGQEMKAEGQYLSSVVDSNNPAFLWRFDPGLARLSPGFIWEEDNKIVGNVTLLSARPPGRYLVANVAVHPKYRRRGYARMMMIAAIEEVRQRLGREILLQVVSDNDKAVALYHSLDFHRLGDMTTWQSSVSRLRRLAQYKSKVKVRDLPRNKWREAYELDNRTLNPNLIWPEPYPNDFYKTSIWRRLVGLLNGHHVKTYVAFGNDGKLDGLAAVKSEWGRPHEIIIRVSPKKKGSLERILLNRAIRTVQNMSRRNVRLIHNADDKIMNELLPAANFNNERTLSHMRYVLK